MRIVFARFLFCLPLALLGQSANAPATELKFEVASVRISPPVSGNNFPPLIGPRGGPGTDDPGQLMIGFTMMKPLLVRAFGVRTTRIAGPAWLDSNQGDHFDIIAKVPAGASNDDANVMLQNLLVERFGLKFHRETREMQGYELVVGKDGLKMKESETAATPPASPPSGSPPQPPRFERDGNGIPQLPPGRVGMMVMGGANGRDTISARQQPISQLTTFLENRLGKPVVDKTGLTAKYDFGFAFEGGGQANGFATAGGPGQPADQARDPVPSLSTAVQQELGLRLDQKKVPVQVLVIDRLERVPSDN